MPKTRKRKTKAEKEAEKEAAKEAGEEALGNDAEKAEKKPKRGRKK